MLTECAQKDTHVWRLVGTQTMATPALTLLAGPSWPSSDSWRRTTGRTFSSWLALLSLVANRFKNWNIFFLLKMKVMIRNLSLVLVVSTLIQTDPAGGWKDIHAVFCGDYISGLFLPHQPYPGCGSHGLWWTESGNSARGHRERGGVPAAPRATQEPGTGNFYSQQVNG